jgi:hypothetical protein
MTQTESELIRRLQSWREQYAFATDTTLIHENVDDAVERIYRLAGRPVPEIVWTDGLTEALEKAAASKLSKPRPPKGAYPMYRRSDLLAQKMRDIVARANFKVSMREEVTIEVNREFRVFPVFMESLNRFPQGSALRSDLRFLFATAWIGLYYALRPDLGGRDRIFRQEADAWLTFSKQAFAVILTEHGCFLVRKPKILSLDALTNLHCADGPCVEFADGTKVYAIHGIHFTPEDFAKLPSMKARDIIQIENVERRRALIEWYGMEKFAMENGAKVIQQDDFGELYRMALQGAEQIVLVRVKNSTPEPDGTFKHYFLRVPPEVRSAREAVAWTFGVPERDYAPSRET